MSEESEKATVVIVTEASGRERRYNADAWQPVDGGMDIARNSRKKDPIVAAYAPGAWLSVREEGATVPDATVRALGIAKRALEKIRSEAEKRGDAEFFGIAADDALGVIFTETDL